MSRLLIFVARASDKLALKAVTHLKELRCETAVIGDEEALPVSAVVFFSTSRNTTGSGWTGGRHAALVQLPEVPSWACEALGLVALRQNTYGDFDRAVEWAARFKEDELNGVKTPALWASRPRKTHSRKPRDKDKLVY
jgi:hypothetical protein